jgi:hypothetical protein
MFGWAVRHIYSEAEKFNREFAKRAQQTASAMAYLPQQRADTDEADESSAPNTPSEGTDGQ